MRISDWSSDGCSSDLEDALEASHDPGSFVWIGLHEPSPEEFAAVRHELGLHELAVEDAVAAPQRPKLEVYDSDLFVVLSPAHYADATEAVDLAEIPVFGDSGSASWWERVGKKIKI